MPSESDDRPRYTKLIKGRWYWDPPAKLRKSHNLRTVALGADQVAAWAYARALNRDNLHLGPGAPVSGSVRWFLDRFLESDVFGDLAPATQRDYRWLALRVLAALPVGDRTLGEFPVLSISPARADAIYARLRDKNASAAHYACRFARRAWHWGIRRELVDKNPWTEMGLRSLPARYQRWTPVQVAEFRAKAIEMGRPSVGLAVLLSYWLSHRQGDVLRLTWAALGVGEVKTRKTKQAVPVVAEAYPELAAALAAERDRQAGSPTPSAHVVVCEMTLRPWQRHVFGHEFRRIADAAGLPRDIQFRDLRATALTELGDAGADVIDLSTHSGHQTMEMARRYVRRTPRQFRQAAEKRVRARENET